MEHDNNITRKINDLVEWKSSDELNANEKALVLEALGSEKEYNALRRISLALVEEKADLSPDPQLLSRLAAKLPTRRRSFDVAAWFHYPVPAYSLVVVLILLVATLLFVQLKIGSSTSPTPQHTVTLRVDTIRVTAAPDTIYVDRIVVKYAQPPTPKAADFSLVKNDKGVVEEASPGVSMKDKEELEDLLVSGS